MVRLIVVIVVILAVLVLMMISMSGDMDSYKKARHNLVEKHIVGSGIKQEEVLRAMLSVPRHMFVPPMLRYRAYENRPLSIGHRQTISQPSMVAVMTELAQIDENSKVLEIGTGSGYQAAILSVIADQVYSIEYIEPLGLKAKALLSDLGYDNVEVKIGDGYQGWPEHQPFDAIIVTAAPDHVPEPLIRQLKVGGRLIIPVGTNPYNQDLLLIEKDEDGKLLRRSIVPVRFVPFLGENK